MLKVRTKDGKIISNGGLQSPCPSEELDCDTTSLDPYAYTWDALDICLLAIHLEEDVHMIKQGNNNYFIVSERNNTSKNLFEVKPEPQIFCNKPVFVTRGCQIWWI